MFFEIMDDSVSPKALSPVANVDLTDSDGLKAGVRIFSELEVTLTGDLPCAFGPRFDIYAARIAFDEKEVSVCDASPFECLIVALGV